MLARLLFRIFNIPQVRQVISPRHKLGEDAYVMWITKFIREGISKLEQNTIYILDVGGSNGYFTSKIYNALKTRSVFIINLDINLSSLKHSRQKYPDLDCICATASFLPFRAGAFNTVYSISLIEHIKEMERAVSEQCRVASETILFQIPNLKYLVELHTMMPLLGIMPSVMREKVWIRIVGNAPIHWNATFKNLVVLFEKNGFTLLSVEKLYHLRVLFYLLLPLGYLAAFGKNCASQGMGKKLSMSK